MTTFRDGQIKLRMVREVVHCPKNLAIHGPQEHHFQRGGKLLSQ